MKFYGIYRLMVLVIVAFISNSASGLTCSAVGNGDWASAATWDCGHVPNCGDTIVIKAGLTVTITSQQDYESCGVPSKIYLYGNLNFTNGNKLRLACNSVIYIFSTGSIIPGSGGGNSNFIEICDDIVWSADDGIYYGSGCLPSSAPGCAAVLPVELIEFSAVANKNKIDIKWITASEKDNSNFQIQRSSNAVEFENIADIKTQAHNGNSQKELNYQYEDVSPLNGVSYYRLKQFNKDNSFTYSDLISVNYDVGKDIRFIVFPNPNSGEFTADISGIENNHEVKIVLTSDKGDVVFESRFFIQESNSTKFKIVPSVKLPNGLYICTLIVEGIEYKVKVIVS